ncbi:cupin domain-containing protein [Azospirillum doebereinerae]|uniref:Cupin domain-containing protein n=1 Tax=Azospirillum doebereinerae TaxID=92933 RepID=A0A433JAT7_9PROT|nr:cupin domain-containing protein [Azospirillum doebereinerae]MCG5242129.1 cupin domain-containing protein [Azospirillum doebereinerae]RUQ72926.1 cupin domain-containing protein [Azospirillum doebereinerae]
MTGALDAERLIALLGLQPHPEGGHYVETYRAPAEGRGAVTAIYFLLKAGERSHWHRVDAVEVWLWHGGAPLELLIYDEVEAETRTHRLGMDIAAGERPQAVVPVGAWQAARGLEGWSLVSCTVAPAFEFAGFTMAPSGWEPPR